MHRDSYEIYDRKIMCGEITFSGSGINKNHFTRLCIDSEFVIPREELENICNKMNITGEERSPSGLHGRIVPRGAFVSMKDFNTNFNRILVETYHHMLMTEETKRKYSSASFSFRDRNAIAYLMQQENGAIISDVAEFLKISRPSTTTLIKKLEKYGLVERTAEPGDERSTR